MIGRIYKIKSHLGDEVFIGSTIQSLSRRFTEHKSEFNRIREDYCTSCYLFRKYGVENCYIELIKEYEIIDRRHLEVYEALWMYKLKPINRNSSFRLFLRTNSRFNDLLFKCYICDCEFRRDYFQKHIRTKKHIDNVNRNNNQFQ